MKRIILFVIICISLTGCHSVNRIIESENVELSEQNINNKKYIYNYSLFDYVMIIDGVQYKLPARADKFIDNGWKIMEAGELNPGDSAITKLKKDNAEIDVVIKNYNNNISNYENGYICGIEVGEYYAKSGLEFDIPLNISVGSSLQETKKWHDKYFIIDFYINSETKDYTIVDDLYFKEKFDRKEKGECLTKWSADPVVDVESEVIKQINFDTIYQVDIDGDGQKDQVDFKYLNYDNGTLLSIVNGNVRLLRISTDIRNSSMIVRENGTCAVIFSLDEIDNYSPCIIYQPHKSGCNKVWEDSGFVISDTLTNRSLRLEEHKYVVGSGWKSETDYDIDENYALVRAGNSKLTELHERKGIKTIKRLPVKLISGEGTVTESELESGTELQFLETDYQSLLKFQTSPTIRKTTL